jgi:hypothetical protein
MIVDKAEQVNELAHETFYDYPTVADAINVFRDASKRFQLHDEETVLRGPPMSIFISHPDRPSPTPEFTNERPHRPPFIAMYNHEIDGMGNVVGSTEPQFGERPREPPLSPSLYRNVPSAPSTQPTSHIRKNQKFVQTKKTNKRKQTKENKRKQKKRKQRKAKKTKKTKMSAEQQGRAAALVDQLQATWKNATDDSRDEQ